MDRVSTLDTEQHGRMNCDCRVGHDGIGHDRLGHLIANALARAGLLPASDDDLAALTPAQLQALPGLGPASVRRVRAAVAGRDHDAQTGTAKAARARRPDGHLKGLPCACDPRLLDFGHDERGHRLSMRLARAGWFAGDEKPIAALTDADLLDLREVGPVLLARSRERIPARTASYRTGEGPRGA